MLISNPLLRQYAAVIAVNFMVLCMGMDVSWTSPALVKIRDPTQTPLSHPITDDDAGWIVSIGYIFAVFTLPCTGLMVDKIGRKQSLLAVCLPKVFAGVMTIFATEVWMLLVARVINITMGGVAVTITMIYSTEIASKEIRGSLGSMITILCSLGGLIMMGIGPYVSYLNLCIMMATVTACASIPLLFIPDTPYSLYKKGQIEEARNVLIFFRGSNALAEEELNGFSQKNSDGKFEKMEILKNKIYLKTLGIAIIMGLGMQMIGFNFIWFYLQTILETTDTSISPALCSLLISSIQVLASISVGAVSDKFGRKPIIISTLLGIAVGMIGLGIFFFIKQHGVIISGFLNYLPLMSFAFIAWCHNGGVGSQYFVLIAELLDDRIRGIGSSASVLTGNISAFLLARYTLSILSALGSAATFFMFGVICIVMSVFVFLVIPETKQKTIAEIQIALGGLRGDEERKDCVSRL